MSEAEFPPAAIAGAVAAAKGVLRLQGDAEDTVLERMAASALALAEAFVGQRLIVRAFGDTVAADGAWHRLTAEPVVSITGGGEAVDIDADAVGWVRSGGGGVVSVGYTAGLAGSWEALPPALAQGCAMLAAHLFEGRTRETAPPAAIAALWRPWRRVRVGSARR